MTVSVQALDEVDLGAAARIYAQGILLEIPPGSKEPLEELVRVMHRLLQQYLLHRENRRVWVAIRNNSPCGILDFYQRGQRIHIRFICGIPPRQGTGTILMTHLVKFAAENNIALISTTVSSRDSRAMSFYFQHLGFQKAGLTNQKLEFDLYFATIRSDLLLQRL